MIIQKINREHLCLCMIPASLFSEQGGFAPLPMNDPAGFHNPAITNLNLPSHITRGKRPLVINELLFPNQPTLRTRGLCPLACKRSRNFPGAFPVRDKIFIDYIQQIKKAPSGRNITSLQDLSSTLWYAIIISSLTGWDYIRQIHIPHNDSAWIYYPCRT